MPETIDHCLCGAPVDVTAEHAMLLNFTEPHFVRGCKACKYTGTKPAPKLGAIVIRNDNGGK